MDISIVIPTIRPNTIKKTVSRIQETVTGIDYEIIVTSPFQLEFPIEHGLKIIKEEEKLTKHEAINQAVKLATGKYLFHIPDYLLVETNTISSLIQQMEKHDDELYVVSPRWHTLWEVIRVCWCWHDTYFATLPCIKTENLSRVGEFYNTTFIGYCGDIDLSLRVLKAGGKVELLRNCFVEVYTPEEEEDSQKNEDIFWNKDDVIFKKIWGESSYIVPKTRIDIPDNSYSLEINKYLADLPNEKCSRIFMLLKNNKLDELEKELNTDTYVVSRYLLLPLLYFVLLFYFYIPSPSLRDNLLRYILQKIKETTCPWSLQIRQELINRFTVRPENEVTKEDIQRLFGYYGTEGIFNVTVGSTLRKIADIVDFVVDQMAIVKPDINFLYNIILKDVHKIYQ